MLYVFGGRNHRGGPMNIVEMLDTWHGQWLRCPPMPTRRAGSGAATLPDGRMLVTGGYNELGIAEGLLASCDAFDPVRGAWEPAGSVAPLGRGRWGHGCAALRGRVFAVGGCSLRTRAAPREAHMETLKDCEVFDPAANHWSPCAPMQIPRSGARAVALAGGRSLAAVGGCDDVFGRAETQPSVEIYDTASGVWTLLAERLQYSRTTAASIATGALEILVVGGAPSLATAEIYDVVLPEEGDRSEPTAASGATSSQPSAPAIADLAEGRMGCQAAVIDLPHTGGSYPMATRRSVVIIGGERCDDDVSGDYPRIKQFKAVPVLDVATRAWRADAVVPDMPNARTAAALCVGAGNVGWR